MQRMDKLRRSLRDSFRKKREAPESSKPHQWQADEEAVRSGNCNFHVKYLGCVEVFESRGMNVCEEAMKVLRGSRRRPVKALLHISGDGLRVVEDDTKGLIVDQTIEKVSFCAPDRNHERGFSYICRDGTTRRWMCHGFLASKDSGERLSHAVGCAFASCLERKQKREKECGVTMSYDSKTSTFTRSGSFRVPSMTDTISTKSTSPPPVDSFGNPIRPQPNPHAIERPHASVKMLERQGSFRGFTHLASQSPFKRQLSLRLDDLPSNLIRSQQNTADMSQGSNGISNAANSSPAPPPRTQRGRLQSLPTNSLAGHIIPELSSSNGNSNSRDLVKLDSRDLSEYCQEFTHQLSLLAANHDDVKKSTTSTKTAQFPTKFSNSTPWEEDVVTTTASTYPSNFSTAISKSTVINRNNFASSSSTSSKTDNWSEFGTKPGSILSSNKLSNSSTSSPTNKIINTGKRNDSNEPTSNIHSFKPSTTSSAESFSRPLYSTNTVTTTTSTIMNTPLSIVETTSSGSAPGVAPTSVNQRPPLQSTTSVQYSGAGAPRLGYRGGPGRSQSLGADPFDSSWCDSVAKTGQNPTNPFARHQTFQVSM